MIYELVELEYQQMVALKRHRRVVPAGISVSEDRTLQQRDTYNRLMQQVRQYNIENPRDQRRIKYINGSPTIVAVNDENPRQKN